MNVYLVETTSAENTLATIVEAAASYTLAMDIAIHAARKACNWPDTVIAVSTDGGSVFALIGGQVHQQWTIRTLHVHESP